MSSKFQPINRDTPYLLPPSVQDWLPEKHLARFVVEMVDPLDLNPLLTRYEGSGKPPYHPARLLALLFYGYATGTFSSRKLEQATYDSVAFASKHKAMSWQYAKALEEQLRNEVRELLRQAEKADVEDRPEMDIPEELARREDRLAAIKKAREAIEKRAQERFESEQSEYEEKLRKRAEKEAQTGKKARGRAPKAPQPGPRDKDQVNFTAEESRIMPSSEGFVQGYHAQAAVDVESHWVVENHLSQCANDQREIESTLTGLERVESQLGKAENLLADAGYFSAANVDRCEGAEIVPYLSDHREPHNLPWDERFETPAPCPPNADAVTSMAHRLRTAEGKAIYGKRKSTVETVFGIVKEVLGFRQFHLRGLQAAQGEWNLVCMAWNLKRMYALRG